VGGEGDYGWSVGWPVQDRRLRLSARRMTCRHGMPRALSRKRKRQPPHPPSPLQGYRCMLGESVLLLRPWAVLVAGGPFRLRRAAGGGAPRPPPPPPQPPPPATPGPTGTSGSLRAPPPRHASASPGSPAVAPPSPPPRPTRWPTPPPPTSGPHAPGRSSASWT